MRYLCALTKALVFVVALSGLALAQQTSFHQEVFTQARPGARVAVDGSAYHQVSWVTSGGPGACYIALDYSHDGMVWFLGGTIPIRDCTKSGSSPVRNEAGLTYVRMNLNSLSPTAAIRATYTGYQTNPGPTGTVTSVFGRTGDVVAQQGDYNVADITGAASLFSPNFTGSPTAPTPDPNDNSTRIATTAWVTAHCTNCGGGGGGTGGAVSSVFGRTGVVVAAANDYNVSQVTGAAGLASPVFTGTPRVPQPGASDNSDQIATTAFVLAHAGTGGGTTLDGCSTTSTGNLVCLNSVQGGTGPVGMFTLPFAASGLPAPPTTALAAIAADSTGHLFWSPGSSTPFSAIGAGGGQGTTGTATALQFGTSTHSLSATAPSDGECLAVSQGTIVGVPCGGGGGGVVGGLGGVTIIE